MGGAIERRLSMPSGNVQDLRYLYAVVAALARRNGSLQQGGGTFQYLAKAINDYNEAKASRFGLSFKPRGVNVEVIKHVVSEIRDLGLIAVEDQSLALTNAGRNVAALIDKGDSLQLKTIFGALILQTYSVFEDFLTVLKRTSGGQGIPVPSVNAALYDRYEENPKQIGAIYLSIVRDHCSDLVPNPDRLAFSLADPRLASMNQRTQRIKALQSILEKHVIEHAFAPLIKSRRVYDFVRSRTTFLEFTNYAVFDFGGAPAELTYPTSDFGPIFAHGMRTVEYASRTVYVNSPSYEEVADDFRSSISRAYKAKSDEFGYARIADIRDQVCRELRVSDNLFDNYLGRVYREEPNWLSLTYSGASDIVTEKRLPIVFEKPVRELFTLLRIAQRR